MVLKLTKAESRFKKSANETKIFKIEYNNKIINEIAPIPMYIVDNKTLTSFSLLYNSVGSFVFITFENPKSKR